MLGSDSCMKTTNMEIDEDNLELGLKLVHTMFDPAKVDVMKLLLLIPSAWEEMVSVSSSKCCELEQC